MIGSLKKRDIALFVKKELSIKKEDSNFIIFVMNVPSVISKWKMVGMIRKVFLLLIVLSIILISGCSNEEAINQIIDNKCLEIKSFNMTKENVTYSLGNIEICLTNKSG